MSLFSRTDRSPLGQWWWTIDRPMLAAFAALIIFGLLMVTTASPPVAQTLGIDPYHFLKRHILMLAPALILFFGTSMLDRRMVWRFASLIFLGSIAAMIMVQLWGMEIKGAKRWLHLFGFSLQPSEFLKPAFAIAAAWFMALEKQGNLKGNIVAGGLFILSTIMLLMQPDFGMTFVVACIWATQIFLAGLPFRYVLVLGGMLLLAVAAVYLTFGHVQSRVDRFLNPDSGDNYQVEKSIEAFENGGLLGTGPGQGTIKITLPDAHADFIFSVAGEELGLVFIALIMALFAFVILRGFSRLMESGDMFSLLAAGGLLTMFGLQAFIHMGSALNLLPAKGMTLPFISYGGSSLMSMGLSMGAVLALTRRERTAGLSRASIPAKSQ